MAFHPRSSFSRTPSDMPATVRLWLYRLLVPLGGHREFMNQHGFGNEALAEALGLGDWAGTVARDFDLKMARADLRKRYQTAEHESAKATVPVCLSHNVSRLAQLIGLSATDCRILEFAVLIQIERLLDDTADYLGKLSSVKVFHALSVLLDIPEHEVRTSLSVQGTLARSGLVSIGRSGTAIVREKLELLSDNFADHIYSSDADPICLLSETVAPSAPPHLGLADYEHVAPSLAVLQPYLGHAIATGRKGVNVFLYGEPGTGKSQLAKVLAMEHDCELFEVASEDMEGYPVQGELRLRAFRAAQSFFARRRALIVFDEAEDVFNDGDHIFGRKSTAQTRKAWINRVLEENAVPTLWLSNSIRGLDPAFIRRFDMVFELPVPPRKQRERILQDVCSDLLDAPGIARIAESEVLAPAVVSKAVSVVRSIRDELGEAGAAGAFELLIGNTLEAQGHRPIRRNDPTRLPEFYDPAFIHADSDLARVADGLMKSKSGRLCLYGPPGTGKTAYGRWLAEQLGAPLLVRRASDLMSKWVGGSEKNIAGAFRQAEQDGALLLIDEIDSFLQDRRGARHSWEFSQVNEMLTQMESFAGVFLASTNLMEGLDQAALRRFDLKVKFDFLTPEQAAKLMLRYCDTLAIPEPSPEYMARLRHLPKLTPGDFAAVARQSRFRPITAPAALISALEAECAAKEGVRAAIGFLPA
ncbi:MAG: AAA family ATPase [Rhodocyclales bacterium]|nr:AAA family ATPase [Rhodocyclales bacterium]